MLYFASTKYLKTFTIIPVLNILIYKHINDEIYSLILALVLNKSITAKMKLIRFCFYT